MLPIYQNRHNKKPEFKFFLNKLRDLHWRNILSNLHDSSHILLTLNTHKNIN